MEAAPRMVQPPFPTLTPEARRALEIILSRGAIDGSSLMKALELGRPGDLVAPIRELLNKDLIEVGGSIAATDLPFARFAVRPSAKEYVYNFLKQTMA